MPRCGDFSALLKFDEISYVSLHRVLLILSYWFANFRTRRYSLTDIQVCLLTPAVQGFCLVNGWGKNRPIGPSVSCALGSSLLFSAAVDFFYSSNFCSYSWCHKSVVMNCGFLVVRDIAIFFSYNIFLLISLTV